MDISKKDFEFLLSLIPDWVHDPNKGHDPTMYGTGSYLGDVEVHNRLEKIIMKNKKEIEKIDAEITRCEGQLEYISQLIHPNCEAKRQEDIWMARIQGLLYAKRMIQESHYR